RSAAQQFFRVTFPEKATYLKFGPIKGQNICPCIAAFEKSATPHQQGQIVIFVPDGQEVIVIHTSAHNSSRHFERFAICRILLLTPLLLLLLSLFRCFSRGPA